MNLENYISGLLLRYLRNGRSIEASLDPNIHLQRDLEYLRLNWAVSSAVYKLCRYVKEHRFELQASTENDLEIDDINIRGRLDARKTILLQLISGHPTQVAYHSLKKSFNVGANQVLAWVLNYSYKYVRRWIDLLEKESSIIESNPRAKTREIISLLADVQRMQLIKETLSSAQAKARPTKHALQQSKISRRKLYQLAYEAYIFLEGIERGKPEDVCSLLEETLIRPSEDYQILELSLAICMAQALSDKLGKDVFIKEITPKGDSAVLLIGDISISWQSRTDSYSSPPLEPSEILLQSLLPSYGLNTSVDRPDVIVRNERTKFVLAIGEAKSFKSKPDGWRDPLRHAISQIIRYSRGYASGADQEALIARSCIALSEYNQINKPPIPPTNGPVVLEVADILKGSVHEWVNRILPLI